MKLSADALLGSLLWLNAVIFLAGAVGGWTFEQWIAADIFAVVLCGGVGFAKRLRILQLIAAAVLLGSLFRFATTVWLLIDIFVIGGCSYAGFLFFRGKTTGRGAAKDSVSKS
jgi:hypothetical protein